MDCYLWVGRFSGGNYFDEFMKKVGLGLMVLSAVVVVITLIWLVWTQ